MPRYSFDCCYWGSGDTDAFIVMQLCYNREEKSDIHKQANTEAKAREKAQLPKRPLRVSVGWRRSRKAFLRK